MGHSSVALSSWESGSWLLPLFLQPSLAAAGSRRRCSLLLTPVTGLCFANSRRRRLRVESRGEAEKGVCFVSVCCRHLQKNIGDFVGALAYLPRARAEFYISCWQSAVWNDAASERLRKGATPLDGDLVLCDGRVAVCSDVSSVSFSDVVLPLFGDSVVVPSWLQPRWDELVSSRARLPSDHILASAANVKGAYRCVCSSANLLELTANATRLRAVFDVSSGVFATSLVREFASSIPVSCCAEDPVTYCPGEDGGAAASADGLPSGSALATMPEAKRPRKDEG